jgi:vancomycin resistance protein YoaR
MIKVLFSKDDSQAANDPVSAEIESDNDGDGEKVPVAETEQGVIGDGVYIAGNDVSGMDYTAVNKTLDDYVASVVAGSVDINIGKKTVTATLEGVGAECDTDAAIVDAFALEDPGKIDLAFDIDEEMFRQFVERECRKYEVQPKNAKLKRENGAFVVKRGKVGKTIDEAATRELLVKAVNESVAAGGTVSIDAVIKEEDPDYTSEDMARCKDVIGKFATNYSEGKVQRSANLRNAVSFINGTIVYPGETMSVAGKIFPLSEDNGYKPAPSYENGHVVDSLGGGVCQVSTTLYNAVLRAELEVVQRQNHSMMVDYVQPSMDAAIAGDYKDLKFTNNTDTPIYIEGSAYGGILTFTLYGHETRPSSRKIEFLSEKAQTIQPGADVVTKDPNMAEGTEHVTQSAHIGYVANLYKIVYENGVEVSREKVNSSRYNASPRHVTVGTKKAGDDKDKEEDKDKDKKDKDKADNNKTGKDKTSNDKADKDKTDTKPKSDESKSSNSEANTSQPAHAEQPAAEQPVVEQPAPEQQTAPDLAADAAGGADGGAAPDAAADPAAVQ